MVKLVLRVHVRLRVCVREVFTFAPAPEAPTADGVCACVCVCVCGVYRTWLTLNGEARAVVMYGCTFVIHVLFSHSHADRVCVSVCACACYSFFRALHHSTHVTQTPFPLKDKGLA